ncbi:MAG: radical SAM protein, partial [Deltaproteobacteria bacterium]|nr:radical SAM protein [Deltaproteobacteria bacterium]
MTPAKTAAFSRNSTNVFFHILTQCNLKCRHCYINPAQHGQNTLPLSTIQAWLEPFSENSNTKNLIFLGGEPTLHPDLPAAIRHARKLGFGSITVDTNGYLFHDILGKVDPDEVDTFSFSLDGATQQINDRIRG